MSLPCPTMSCSAPSPLSKEIADNDPVHFNNVLGVPQFAIPKLGYVSDFIQNPPGTYITVGIGALLIAAVFLPDLLKRKKDGEDEQEAAAEAQATAEENERLKAELESLRAEMAEKASDGE